MSEEKPVEWRCLVGGTPDFGYTGSTMVGHMRIVTKEKQTIAEVLEDLRLKVEAALRESGDQRRVEMIPPWQE